MIFRATAALADMALPYRFVGRLIFCPSGQVLIVFCVGDRFLQLKQSLNNQLITRRTSSDHHQTDRFMSVVGQSTFGFSKNVGRQIPIDNRKSTESRLGFRGDFDKSADGRPTDGLR